MDINARKSFRHVSVIQIFEQHVYLHKQKYTTNTHEHMHTCCFYTAELRYTDMHTRRICRAAKGAKHACMWTRRHAYSQCRTTEPGFRCMNKAFVHDFLKLCNKNKCVEVCPSLSVSQELNCQCRGPGRRAAHTPGPTTTESAGRGRRCTRR